MDMAVYERILDEAGAFVYDINLHHRGEPTLHPDLDRMIQMARGKDLRVKLHTNGTTLTESLSERLLASDLSLISFSFDGYCAEMYEKTRVGARFEKTLNNIRRFLEMKKKRPGARVKTVMELMELNGDPVPADEKKGFVRSLKKQGLDRLIVKKPHNWGGNIDIRTHDSKWFAPCTFPWHALVILWDGRVGPCPHDFFAKTILGDVRHQTLREVFNGTPAQQLREEMAKKDFSQVRESCRGCDSIRRSRILGFPAASFKYIKE